MPTDPLAGALRECSLHCLLILVSKALTRSGFGDVEIVGRRQPGQKSRFGGHEIACAAALGPLPLKVLVKVVRDDLRLRHFDELAGGVIRGRADLGLLVSPFEISASAARAQALYRPARVESMDGNGLAELIRCSGFAVRPDGSPDYAFLSELETVSERLLEFVGKERP